MVFSRSYNDPGHSGDTHSIVGTRGRAGSVSRPGAPTRPAQGPQGAGGDIYELLNPSITQTGRRTDKPVELYQTWNRRDPVRKNVIQQGYALTVNTLAGLGWAERQWIAAGQQMEMASGSLLAHYDDVALPFATESANLDYVIGQNQNRVVSTVFQGRAVWGFGQSTGKSIWAETSMSDPTPVLVTGLSDYLIDLTTASLDGIDCLIVATGAGVFAYSSLNPLTIHALTAGVLLLASILQVPLPRQPLLIRLGSRFFLERSDWSVQTPQLNVNITQTNRVDIAGRVITLVLEASSGCMRMRPARSSICHRVMITMATPLGSRRVKAVEVNQSHVFSR